MFIVCLIVLACFGIGAGMFIGAGNRGGVLSALVCGAVTGLLLNLPFLLDGDRLSNVVLFLSAVAGALLIKFVAEEHALSATSVVRNCWYSILGRTIPSVRARTDSLSKAGRWSKTTFPTLLFTLFYYI